MVTNMNLMAPSVLSEKYQLIKRISQNDVSQSWVAAENNSSKSYFIKLISENNCLDLKTKTQVLKQSFNLQKKIRTVAIPSAIGKISRGSKIAVIYPFFERTNWKTLSVSLFNKYFPDTIIQMCQIVDYLHLLDIVHCDLKLENFVIYEKNGKPEIRLLDLDFIMKVGDVPNAMVFGSPGHIAPELLKNRPVSWQTDNYSFGVMIQNCLEEMEEYDCEGLIPKNSFASMSLALTNEDRLKRPASLLGCLEEFKIIDDISQFEKRLLEMQITSSFLVNRNNLRNKKGSVRSFLLENNLLGVNEEIIEDFEVSLNSNFIHTISIAQTFLAKCQVRRTIKYWHLDWEESHYYQLFNSLDIDKKSIHFKSEADPNSIKESIDLFEVAKQLEDSNKPFKAFLLYLRCLKLPSAESPDKTVSFSERCYYRLFKVSKNMQKLDDAVKYGEKLWTIISKKPKQIPDFLIELIHTFLYRGEYERAEELINCGFKSYKEDSVKLLELRCFSAWLAMINGKYEAAIETLNIVKNKCEQLDIRIWLRAQSYLAAIYWYQENFEKAHNIYAESISVAKTHISLYEARALLYNYGSLLLDLARYEECIVNVQESQNIQKRLGVYGENFDLYRIMALSNNRLGRYDRALEAYQKYLVNSPNNSQDWFLGIYYFHRGVIDVVKNTFESAKEYLHYASQLLNKSKNRNILIKIMHNFMDIEFHQGHIENFKAHLSTYNEQYSDVVSKASHSEINLLITLSKVHYENCDKYVLFDNFKDLRNKGCRFYSAICLFYILLYEMKDKNNILEIDLEGYWSFLTKSNVPLFKAILLLLEIQAYSENDYSKNLEIYKKVYKIFLDYNFLFWAALVCKKIADIYLENNLKRPATKFLEQAIKLMELVGNLYYFKKYRTVKDQISKPHEYELERLQALYKISSLLRNIDNFENSLNRIIKFAISETGAERGAILFYSKDLDRLQLKAYMNCDDDSLADIETLSQSIPQTSVDRRQSLLISDAQNDKMTKDFKSVYIHNIRSVLCVPISDGKDNIGVLYLDHHTLPALFEESDLNFVEAMTNFIAIALRTALSFKTMYSQTIEQQSDLLRLGKSDKFITQCPITQSMLDKIPEIANTNASILLIGESGTGKEIIADMIHNLSHRCSNPYLKLNCTSIPESLIEGELFGVAKGVATGVEARIGKFQAADGGTLLMDEIGDMPLRIQAKLLRILEYQKFEMVGSIRTISTDIRFVYSTNRNLNNMVKKNRFRRDLFHRINTFTIEIPPLRKRTGDIPLLIDYFMGIYCGEERARPIIPDDIIQSLMLYSWPGNVRELRNLVEQWCILLPCRIVEFSNLTASISSELTTQGDSSNPELEKRRIAILLKQNNWNQSKVARILDISLSTLRRKIKKYGISRTD